MSPPPPLAAIGVHWTDGELFVFLERYMRGSPLPANVTPDINPYLYKPENLPGDIWYLVSLEEKKDSEKGFWRAKGEPCQIFTNLAIIGWRTTFEFYEGQAPHGCKTDWLSQEYRITRKGPCNNRKLRESNSLCRVFLLDEQSLKNDKQDLTAAERAGENLNYQMQLIASDAKSNTGEGSTSRPQVNSEDNDRGRLAVSESHLSHPVENLLESSCLSVGDFLELRDLESPSFSSENSSCLTMSSDECFDALALLQELDTDINEDLQKKDADCKFNISSSRRPNEVVICPATSGSLNSAPKTHETELKNKGASSKSHVGATSSGSQKAETDGKRKYDMGRNRKKRKMKYLCFLPF